LTRLWIYLIFKFPTLDLLKEYSTGGITINQEELEENKTELDTAQLQNRNCTNKATVGPSSVTLYEIVPEAGIRISKIKSLEDDIALSLSALEFVLLRLFQEKELLESKFQ
jgi:S-DNA-T family DNA segregation ATPase FtsK/SpoIIIE